LDRLPVDLRLAVVLVDLMELDYTLAAAALNTSCKVISHRLAQARRVLC
jgi:DNA-directed RNA polymerase specialized sigma24 family protein